VRNRFLTFREDPPMKRLTISVTIAVSMIAFSWSAAAAPQWSGSVSIVDIEVSDAYGVGGHVWVRFSAEPFSTPCSLRNGQWLASGDANNIKNIMTVATSAKLAGRPVQVLWNQGASNQCSGGGTEGYPAVVGLLLK